MAVEGVDREWLSEVLGTPVTHVDVSPVDAFNSRTSRLTVTCADPAEPRQLVLKRNDDAEWAVRAGRLEAAFYLLARSLPSPPPGILRCLAAGVDEDTGDSFVLLPDVSDTHAPPVTRDQQIGLAESVPAPGLLDACVTALARHHAYWWCHPDLSSDSFERGMWTRDDLRLAVHREQGDPEWRRADLPEDALAVHDAVLDGLEVLWATRILPRLVGMDRVTLTHGDVYFANFLCPRDGDGTTYLVDWQGPLVDHPGTDLANLLATFWTREQRREDDREHRCLRRYLAVLEEAGVEGYGWDDLVADYRHGLMSWLLVPVHDAASGSDPSYWVPKLTCLLDAVRDWDRLALLD